MRQLTAASTFKPTSPPPAMPTLILTSLADRLVDWRCSQALAQHWQCPLVCHENAGHDLPLDDPDWSFSRSTITSAKLPAGSSAFPRHPCHHFVSTLSPTCRQFSICLQQGLSMLESISRISKEPTDAGSTASFQARTRSHHSNHP